MTGNGPWSVKGIDPKARAAAKEAAQRHGMTLGEWLSYKMLEPDTGVPAQNSQSVPAGAGQAAFTASGSTMSQPIPSLAQPVQGILSAHGDHRPAGDGHLFSEIENLARRLEATEHRSTLAITGIDQSVLGLLARLESVEKSQQNATDQLASSMQAIEARLTQADETAEDIATGFSRDFKDIARRVDTIGDKADTSNSATRHELGKDIELINTRSDEISQRLAEAERHTDNAIRSLEASFSSLDGRIKDAETSLADNSNDGLSELFDKRFALVSNELVKVVAETRGQLAAQIQAEASNPKVKEMEAALQQVRENFASTENRHASTLERIAVEVSKMGNAVESRFRDADDRNETKLQAIRQEQAESLDKVGRSMTDVVERLENKLQKAEDTRAASDELESRLRESENRTGQMVEDVLQRLHKRLDETEDQNAAAISPVQRALNNLTERLNSIEDRSAPPFANSSNDQGANLSAGRANDGLPEQNWQSEADPMGGTEELVIAPLHAPAGSHATANAEAGQQNPPMPPLGGNDTYGHDPYGQDPNAQYGNIGNAPGNGYGNEYSDETYSGTAYAPAGHVEGVHDPAAMGATADNDFMAAARRSVLESGQGAYASASYPSGPSAPVTKAVPNTGEGGGKNKKLLIAASIFALVAIGAAASMTMLEFGGNKPADYQTVQDNTSSYDPLLIGTASQENRIEQASSNAAASGEAPMELPVAEPKEIELASVKPKSVQPKTVPPKGVQSNPVVRKPKPVTPTVTQQRRDTPASKPARQLAQQQASERQNQRAAQLAANSSTTSAPQQTRRTAPSVVDPSQPISLGHSRETTPGNARPSMEQAAQAGDPVAQYQYAISLVDTGQSEQAVTQMKAAAERGLPAAQYQLAKYYETGTGVPADEREARRWTERAANGGNRRAMHNLAMYHAEGRSVPQSYESAAKWFEEAALLGLANSQFNLALLYEQGLGVPKSLPDAYAWYSIAAKAGDRGAQGKIDELRSALPADAVSEAQTITSRFRPRPLDLAANGVFRNVNWARAQANDEQTISRAQILLARLGYQPGPADGNIGENTRMAVISYERDHGLAQTGRIDRALIAKLERSSVN